MRIAFLTTTFNRSESCRKLIDQLYGMGDIYLINDGSKGYGWVKDYKINYHKNKQNLGKAGYYQTVTKLWQMAGYGYDYYFMIPDDMLLVYDFLNKAISTWNLIDDPQKMTLNLFVERSRIDKPNWTGIYPIEFEHYRQIGWVDMVFMAEGRFFEFFGCKLPNPGINYQERPQMSSGVGSYISKRLVSNNYTMYQAKSTLLMPQPEAFDSQMNPWRTNQEINQVL